MSGLRSIIRAYPGTYDLTDRPFHEGHYYLALTGQTQPLDRDAPRRLS
jgi:hypothetical protein